MSLDKNELLKKVKELLKEEVTSISFDTWIKPLEIESINDNHIVFIANSEYQRDYLQNRYASLMFNTLKYITNKADILIVAVGKKHLITEDMVKDNSVVIDVGISKIDNKLYGDVDFLNVKDKVNLITPVPGGVGPMTIASLAENVLKAYKMQNDID